MKVNTLNVPKLNEKGHRLKNSNSKIFEAVCSLSVNRRIILSGTPIQNNLGYSILFVFFNPFKGEFHAMCHFIAPNVLDTYAKFKRNYETAIHKAKDGNASVSEKEYGKKKMDELVQITSQFILRRTADINTQYLPLKCRGLLDSTSIYTKLNLLYL